MLSFTVHAYFLAKSLTHSITFDIRHSEVVRGAEQEQLSTIFFFFFDELNMRFSIALNQTLDLNLCTSPWVQQAAGAVHDAT